MERTVAQGRIAGRHLLIGDLTYAVAGPEDGHDLRLLLADSTTDGWIRLALAREPDAFAAAAVMGSEHGIIIARSAGGEPVGMCEWSARPAYVNGEVRLLAYLGALRVAERYRHRIRVIKGGFEAVRTLLHLENATPYALTAIAADNIVALRLLGANLPGMPVYRPLEPFSTFALRPRRPKAVSVRVERAGRDDLAAIAVCLARTYRHYQFAPVWSAKDLHDPARCRGLRPEDFLVVRRGPGIAACVALWDQSAFKQTIVRGYAGHLAFARPLANLVAPLIGAPRLPAPGEPLRQVYLSHLAVADNDIALFLALMDAALAEAKSRDFPLALTGFASRHPFAAALLARYRPREYRTVLHLVHWQDGCPAIEAMESRMPHVEIAVL